MADNYADEQDAALASAVNGSSTDYSHLDLSDCTCGHALESHDPACEECDCIHYEQDGD